jgi:CMP-N,N'-diacetyllegionaminic acid synthase
MNQQVLFFIPARGGSKGLKDKNILPLHGKPMLAWTIDAARQCGITGRIVVSTDSDKIAEVAVANGAEVPGLRAGNLALDDTPTMDVLLDFLKTEEKKGYVPDLVVLLQPTSPLRKGIHIAEAFSHLKKPGTLSVVSVCACEHHPLWSNTLPEDFSMDNFMRPEIKGKNRQGLPPYYRLNGAIYISSPAFLNNNKSFFGKGSRAYIMDAASSVDVDTNIDLKLAALLMQEN